MRKSLLFLAVLLFAVATVASAAPDPWRIKVSDLDPTSPIDTGWVGAVVRETWGTNGGTYRQYYWNAETATTDKTKEGNYSVNSYNASTGAISFGTLTTTSMEGFSAFIGQGLMNVVKVSPSSWKTWKCNFKYTGQDIDYATSTDGANFSAPTLCTTYGSTVQSTSSYGNMAFYVSTGGVYWRLHGNSFGVPQEPQWSKGFGAGTSGVGETEWWDIDTGNAPHATDGLGDPIGEPHDTSSTAKMDVRQEGDAARSCTGSLFVVYGAYHNPPVANYHGEGLGLVIGTGGELVGGDHYVWLSDPDSNNTEGIGNALLGGNSMPTSGLSGPNLRCYMPAWTWMGWNGRLLGLKAKQTDPATLFALMYAAAWDTNSDGTLDAVGSGRAKLMITRNKADLNYDGTVNFQDIGPFSGAYGSTSGTPGSMYNPDCDFNADGKIDFKDIGPLSGRYGTDCSYSP